VELTVDDDEDGTSMILEGPSTCDQTETLDAKICHLLAGGPVGPASRWAATSNVK